LRAEFDSFHYWRQASKEFVVGETAMPDGTAPCLKEGVVAFVLLGFSRLKGFASPQIHVPMPVPEILVFQAKLVESFPKIRAESRTNNESGI